MSTETQQQFETRHYDGHLIPLGPERLAEPELSLYLSLWGQYHASQLQTTALAQALQAMMAVISRRHGFTAEQTIDAEGYIHQQTPATEMPAQENDPR